MERLTARRLTIEVVDRTDVIGIAEWPDGTGWCLIVQSDDEGYHVSNHLGLGVMNGIRDWSFSGRTLYLRFTDEAQQCFGPRAVWVVIDESVRSVASGVRALGRLLSRVRPN